MNDLDKANVTSFESLGLTKPKQPPKTPKLGQEDFMKLMMTQMNNQDPFKPMEDGEFLSQMAQFSAVSGLKDIKDSFLSLTDSLKSNQALQASSMVGRKVLVPGTKSTLAAQGEFLGAVDLPANTGNLTLKITNKAGELVHKVEMGEQAAGIVHFNWDGMTKAAANDQKEATSQRAPQGEYNVHAEIEIDGESQNVDTLIVDKVDSVSLGSNGQGITLNLANAGSAGLSTVKQIM